MAVECIFRLSNDYSQDGDVGICTAISFNWAKYTLKKGKGLAKRSDLKLDTHTLNAQMAVIKKLDGQEETNEYLELFGLNFVAGTDVRNHADIEKFAKDNAPHVAVFWNSHHTMGYNYAHLAKEFFEPEQGLFRAKLTKDIDAKMQEVFARDNYAVVQHAVVVKLQ
jgi:hypothetical protein